MTQTRTPKPNMRRIKMLVKRSITRRARGAQLYDAARRDVAIAMNCGLQLNTPIEIELVDPLGVKHVEQFELVDNFAGERAGRNVVISKYEFKKVSKTKRAKSADTAPAAVMTAGSGEPEPVP